MKKALLLLLLTFSILTLFAEQMIHKTLPNGLEVVVKENFTNNSVAVYCYLRTGTVNEEEYAGTGISHLLEHMVSGGTTDFHTEKEYAEADQRMGAIVNASTWQDGVNYYIVVDKQYANDAVKELAEHIGYCKLEESAMEREKKVIEKEIVMRSTSPNAKMYQRSSELFYPDTPYRFPVIGYTDKLRAITHDDVVNYYNRRHSPENMLVVVCGNFKAEDMMATVEKEWGGLKQRGHAPLAITQQRTYIGESKIVEEFDTSIPTIMINYQLPESAQFDGPALSAALECLTQQRNSPIQYRLVEKEKLCSSFYGYYTRENGLNNPIIQFFCSTDSTKNIPRIMEILDEELVKAGQNGITQAQLKRIVDEGIRMQALDTPDADTEANTIAYTLTSGSRQPDDMDNQLQIVKNLKVADVNQAIKKYLLAKTRIVFMAVPIGDAKLLEKKEEKEKIKGDITKTIINSNLTLLYRKNPRKPIIQGVMWFPLSSEFETHATAGSINYMLNLLTSSPGGKDPLELSQWMEEHSIDLEFSNDRYGTTLSFRCLKQDYPQLKKLLKDSFTKPVFAKSEIDRKRKDELTNNKYRLMSNYSMHSEFQDSLVFPNCREGATSQEQTNYLISLTADSLEALYHKYVKADRALITIFGDLEKDEAVGMAKELFSYLPKGTPTGTRTANTPLLDKQTHINTYDFEPVNINVVFNAPPKDSPDFDAFQVINCLLNGSRGRLYEATRGENNNLAYYAGADYRWNDRWGLLDVSSQTSIDKKDSLITTLKKEVQKLLDSNVTQDEILLSVEEQQKIWDSYMSDNQIPTWITAYESYGLGWEYLFNGLENAKKVTPPQVRAAAKKYLKTPTVFISVPSNNVKKMVGVEEIKN